MAGARAPSGAGEDATNRRTWQLPCSPAAVGRTRRELRTLLQLQGMRPDACDAVLLVAYELIVNGIEHGRTGVRLTVELGPATVRIDVHDGSSRPPQLQRMDPAAVRGRGLQMVDGLAARWGWQPDGAGKTVWAEVATDGHPGPAA
jgi:anti-sigma regulatory factor (Ser/Thr protein kinase)